MLGVRGRSIGRAPHRLCVAPSEVRDSASLSLAQGCLGESSPELTRGTLRITPKRGDNSPPANDLTLTSAQTFCRLDNDLTRVDVIVLPSWGWGLSAMEPNDFMQSNVLSPRLFIRDFCMSPCSSAYIFILPEKSITHKTC